MVFPGVKVDLHLEFHPLITITLANLLNCPVNLSFDFRVHDSTIVIIVIIIVPSRVGLFHNNGWIK